jgi:hypothetical protein
MVPVDRQTCCIAPFCKERLARPLALGLSVMTVPAHAHEGVELGERITTLVDGLDVVDHGCRNEAIGIQAGLAERVLLQLAFT